MKENFFFFAFIKKLQVGMHKRQFPDILRVLASDTPNP